MEEPEDDSAEAAASNGLQLELIKSYLVFARRAIRARWIKVTLLSVLGLGLTLAATVLVPRTYSCKGVMMALGSSVLDRNDTPNPLAGAEGVIMRHENLEGIIRDTDLVRQAALRRPALLRTKDRIIGALFGQPDEKTKVAVLVGTLESKLSVLVDGNELTLGVEWTDGQTAAELVEAARQSFLKARHSAEVSAYEDKMAIMDEHATKLREEVAVLADQLNSTRQVPTAAQGNPAAPGAAARPFFRPAPTHSNPDALMTEEISGLREKLAVDKPKLAELENDWSRRVREEQARLADMQLRLTPSHPEVVTEQRKVAMLTQVPSEVAQLRAEVAALESDIKGRTAVASQVLGAGRAGGAPAGGPGAEPLPAEIIQALQKDDAEPALRAQLYGAVVKYGDLRDAIRTGRIDLDTAQAAFNHRYQVVVPAEAPSSPIKPMPAVIFGGGLALTLLLAGLLPILGELRKGVIVDRWQVQHLQLPVLAELELPPHSD